MPPAPIPKNVKLPHHPHGEYVRIPRDPWMTDSILGSMYGAKLVFVPKPDPDTNPSSSTSPAIDTVIQPHPYGFEKHPAHAARAKWLKDWEEKQRNAEKPHDGVGVLTSPSISESHSQALESQSGASAHASPNSLSSAYVPQAGSKPCTLPRTEQSPKHSSSACSDSTKLDSANASPSSVRPHSTLSLLAEPFQSRTRNGKK